MSDQSVTAGGVMESDDAGMPTHVGRYRLIAPLGEGGFGTVFEAEQHFPVHRRVALKLIKAGMDSRAVIARFELERQALALMDHPHIASVLDAGTTDGGLPFFVMELVEGEPICAYCDRRRLPLRARLELLGQVCSAVQHAHNKGLIHRDLKPSNVLVSDSSDGPFARVIDFGIAKAIGQRLTEDASLTGQQEMIGTPRYMSPEQAEGNPDIDTRSDVYALGTMLYELLTGTTPVQPELLRSASYLEIQRIIREHEAPLPSARVAAAKADRESVSSSRRLAHPDELRRSIRGELDWIAMKALDKDRSRRYQSAAALASDLRRYLDGDAVLAAPPGRAYQLAKFTRRHRVLVAAGSTVALALVAGLAGTLWQAREAQQRAAELQEVANFQAAMLESIDTAAAGRLLVEELLRQQASSGADPAFEASLKGLNATDAAVRLIDGTVLAPAVRAIGERFPDQPKVQSGLRLSIGRAYYRLGRYTEAIPLFRESVSLRMQHYGDNAPETLSAAGDLVTTLVDASQLDEAEGLLETMLSRLPGGDDDFDLPRAVALSSRGSIKMLRGDHAEAERLYREALDLRLQVLGADHEESINNLSDIGLTRWEMADAKGAEAIWREALERARRILGPEHATTLTLIGNLGTALNAQGRGDEAEPLYREALALKRRLRGDSHPSTLASIGNLGYLLDARGDLAGAEPFYVERYERTLELLGPDHASTLTATHNLGYLRRRQERLEEALALFRTALQGRERLLGRENRDTLFSLSSLGVTARQLGHWPDAEEAFGEALRRRERTLGSDHDDTLDSLHDLALLDMDRQRFVEAEPLARRAYEGRLRRHGISDRKAREYGIELATSLAMTGRSPEAERLARELLAAAGDGDTGWQAQAARLPLARALMAQGRHADAEAELGQLATALDADGPSELKRRVIESYDALYLGWRDPPGDIDARRQEALQRWPGTVRED